MPAGLNQTEIQKSLLDRGSTPISIILSEKGFVAQCKTQMLKENDNIAILSFGPALKKISDICPIFKSISIKYDVEFMNGSKSTSEHMIGGGPCNFGHQSPYLLDF